MYSVGFADGVGVETGFPIPRFVSTKSDASNVRTGPGTKYPIRFTLTTQAPLQIIDEYGNWRHIRDWQGEQGWVHKSLLTGRKKAIVTTLKANIHKNKTTDSPIVAIGEKNYILSITECTKLWCKVEVPSPKVTGYILKENIWGRAD